MSSLVDDEELAHVYREGKVFGVSPRAARRMMEYQRYLEWLQQEEADHDHLLMKINESHKRERRAAIREERVGERKKAGVIVGSPCRDQKCNCTLCIITITSSARS